MRSALILSANRYEHYAPLRYCHADAHLLSATLAEWCDYRDNCRVRHILLDRDDRVQAPREVLAAIRELDAESRDMTSQQSFLVYFAGHGMYDEASRTSYLLLPSSAPDDLQGSALALRDLRCALAELKRPIVQIFDACHTGESLGVRGVVPNHHGFVADLKRDADAICERGRGPGWEMLAACDEDEASHEDPQLQHGVFTRVLSDAIRCMPASAELPLALLKDGVCQQVSAWAEHHGLAQNPVFAARTYGRHVFARRNGLATPASREFDPLHWIRSAGERHAITLPAEPRAELDLGALLVPGAPERRLTLGVELARNVATFELTASPSLILAGRRVVRPRFQIGPNHTLAAGPYDWHDHRLRFRFTDHQATFHAIGSDGGEIAISINVP